MKPTPDRPLADLDPHAVEPTRFEECPRCGGRVPVLTRYSTWCECGWNLVASSPTGGGRAARLSASVGRRLGDRLADRLAAADTLQPRLTASKLASFAIAVFVYLLWIGFAVGGVLLLVLPAFPHPPAMLFGALLIGTAVFMRPRLGSMPDEGIVSRTEAPSLYGLADEIADALGTRRVDVIVIDESFNASWDTVGIRRRRVMTLGLPLLTALAPQERVALLAHELAHGRNGDVTRSLLVGSTVGGLQRLYVLLAPDEPEGGIDYLISAVLWLVSLPVLGLLLLQLHLVLRDSQRAEYLADALAADVAGTPAVISAHEKLLLAGALWEVVGRTAHVPAGERDLFGDFARTVRNVPARERERRRRIARLEDSRLDSTHPPTAKRIELLERRAPMPGRVHDDGHRAATTDAELERHRQRLEDRLVDAHRDRLYY